MKSLVKNAFLGLALSLVLTPTAQADRAKLFQQLGQADALQSLGDAASTIAMNPGAFQSITNYNQGHSYMILADRIGILYIGIETDLGETGLSTCTANVINDSLLLTNAHCVDSEDIDYVFFQDNFDVQEMEIQSVYEVKVLPLEIDTRLDFAFLRMVDPVVLRNSEVSFSDPVSRDSVEEGDNVLIIGHPEGMPKMVSNIGCRLRELSLKRDTGFGHSCDTLPGSSGSMVFSDMYDPPRVLGLHYAGGLAAESNTSFNKATYLDVIYETLGMRNPELLLEIKEGISSEENSYDDGDEDSINTPAFRTDAEVNSIISGS